MKARIYHGPGSCSWAEATEPKLQAPADALVRITRTTICDTDLHTLKGDVPEVPAELILGHEGVGIVGRINRSRSARTTSITGSKNDVQFSHRPA